MSECQCATLNDLAVIDMGDHEPIFQTFIALRERGAPWWWLYASRCQACGQVWLVAQEERQNDVFILKRLDQTTVTRLLTAGTWPDDFDQYETLLKIGRAAGREVRFLDPFESSLLATIEDLAKARPGISVAEIAMLLNLDRQLATELARAVVGSTGVTIEFDADAIELSVLERRLLSSAIIIFIVILALTPIVMVLSALLSEMKWLWTLALLLIVLLAGMWLPLHLIIGAVAASVLAGPQREMWTQRLWRRPLLFVEIWWRHLR